MRHVLVLCLLFAGAYNASAQTDIDLPWCEVNPTANQANQFKPVCPQLGDAGRWPEFGVLYDNGVDQPIEVIPGPAADVGKSWSGNVATADPDWVEASLVASERLRLEGLLMLLHRSCAKNPAGPMNFCISLGQAYRALEIATELGPFVIPLPPVKLLPDGSPLFLQPKYQWPGPAYVKPDSYIRAFVENEAPLRWKKLGIPGEHELDARCRTHVCDKNVYTPDQIGRIVREIKTGLKPSEIAVDRAKGCKYVPLCTFEPPTTEDESVDVD